MKRLTIIILLFFNLYAWSENLEEEFKELAEYRIIIQKFSFFNHEQMWNAYPSSFEYILQKQRDGEIEYSVKEIFNIKNIRIIEIEDKTNIGPYANHTYLYAIIGTREDKYFLQQEINRGEIETFIDKFVYKKDDQVDTNVSKIKIIELYNKIRFYRQNVILYNGKNEDEFKILGRDYRFDEFNKLKKSYDEYYMKNVYKLKTFSNDICYYYITYNFDCKNFKIEEILLYRVKG